MSTLSTVAIFGPGLIGGSLALALRKHRPECTLRIWARRPSPALRDQNLPAAMPDIGAAVQDADLCVLCTPIRTMAALAKQIAPHLRPGAVVTDAGSVKGSVVGPLEAILGDRFVGSHPMAGSEKCGLEAAREDLFQGAVSIITPTENSRPEAIDVVNSLWEAVGCRIVQMSPAAHDAAIARVSHLPHAVAAALVNAISLRVPEASALAGGGYRDSTRVAAGPAALWTEIFLENRTELLASLEDFSAGVENLKNLLTASDAAGIEALLTQARNIRERTP